MIIRKRLPFWLLIALAITFLPSPWQTTSASWRGVDLQNSLSTASDQLLLRVGKRPPPRKKAKTQKAPKSSANKSRTRGKKGRAASPKRQDIGVSKVRKNLKASTTQNVRVSKPPNVSLSKKTKAEVRNKLDQLRDRLSHSGGTKKRSTAKQTVRDRIARSLIAKRSEIRKNDYSAEVRIKGDNVARAHVETTHKGQIRVTDVHRGSLPKGSGGILLGRALREHGQVKSGSTFVVHNVREKSTLKDIQKGVTKPERTLLGKMTTKALSELGLKSQSMRFIRNEGHLAIEVKVR